MSLFVTAVLEYTESLIAPIVIHFLWNGVGAIILGGVSLAEDYPHMFNMVISGNSIYPLSRLFILITSKDRRKKRLFGIKENKMEYQYKLRPHHGLCISFFSVKKYSEKYKENNS